MKSNFDDQINRTLNIYSFIVELFKKLETEGVQNIHKRYHTSIKGNVVSDLSAIDDLITELNIITPSEFKEWGEIWLKEYYQTKLDKMVFCYIFLLKIDNVINNFIINKNPLVQFLVDKGPLGYNGQYLFFYKMPNSFFQKKLNNGKIRSGRQTVEYDVNSLNMDFKNFEVIKSSQLLDFQPLVKQYNHKYVFNNELKIAFSPLSFKKWFEVQDDHVSKEFKIHYRPADIHKQNEKIINILIECERLKVDIAVFPELAISPKTEAEIKDFIINSNFKSLKLCFLGSIWYNNVNEAVLINNQGSILLKEQKKIPYKYYDKKEGCCYTEAIRKDEKIYFLDIEGIGRIAYLICADYNDDNLNAVCSKMHTNFIFVSAFTDNTDLMLKTAISHAERKAISTLLCNSCAALSDKDENCIYLTTVPDINNKKLAADIFRNKLPCTDKNCDLCLKIVTFK